MFQSAPQSFDEATKPAPRRTLSEADAIDIWISRWLRIRRKDILQRYRCDPRRLYEIWEGTRYPASREKAWTAFMLRFPTLTGQVDSSPHRRISRKVPDGLQPDLFD